jgi:hypothetical protein
MSIFSPLIAALMTATANGSPPESFAVAFAPCAGLAGPADVGASWAVATRTRHG